MTLNLQNAWVYDIECIQNVFTLDAVKLYSDERSTWEISEFRNDSAALMEWFTYLNQTQSPMIGFNNLGYDYPIIHQFFMRPGVTFRDLHAKSMQIISGFDRWGHQVWASDRFAPQIDLFKIQHFDNMAKSTSLKALQINMRLNNVVESSLGFDRPYTEAEINDELIPYNQWDTKSTKDFAHITMEAIEFRMSMIPEHGIDVLNYNDSKLGSKILEKRLGETVCYDRSSGRKVPRQTVRAAIPINDVIFPYIQFNHPDFKRVLDYLRTQTLTADEITGRLKTKGVFSDLSANLGGLQFDFGTGGMHGSVHSRRYVSDDEWIIRDIDVASLYPSIAIVNKLAPEHLGQAFVQEYAGLLTERAKHAKGTVENAAMKLAANGTYGNSNNQYSVFYDPKYTMTITINGQLLLCKLAEMMVEAAPEIDLIQINTDGITYRIRKSDEPLVAAACKRWEQFTCLKLEDADYSRMWIRDVNNYVAEYAESGKLKQKGAYWHPDPLNYAESISKAGPPAWHKDFNPVIVPRAAVAAMVHGIDPETYMRMNTNPYDFMARAKVRRSDKLVLRNKNGKDRDLQRTTRYFVGIAGDSLVKLSPPPKGAVIGAYKRASKVPESVWRSVNAEIPTGTWDERIHTKNKSTYTTRETSIQAGYGVIECNDAECFDFARVDYSWYVNEAKKLIV